MTNSIRKTWRTNLHQQLLTLPAALPGSMFGLDGYTDNPLLPDYCPWEHAAMLNARIVSNMNLPQEMPAAYSPELHMIFYRADLPEDVERCAIAHELVHYEYRDKANDARAEVRANRISTLRLIRPSRLASAGVDHTDLPGLARELTVTQDVMRLYRQMGTGGTLPQ